MDDHHHVIIGGPEALEDPLDLAQFVASWAYSLIDDHVQPSGGGAKVEPTGQARACEHDDPKMIFAGAPFCDIVLTGIEELPGPGQESWAKNRVLSAGGSATRAVAASRLGVRAAVVGALGTDVFGRIVDGLLAAEASVDRRWLRPHAGWQTPVSIAVTNGQDRRFLSSGSRGLPQPERSFEPADLPTARFVQTAATPDQPEWILRQRAAGATIVAEASMDVGSDRAGEVLDGLAAVDVLIVNADEARAYTGVWRLEDAARMLSTRVPMAVVTAGPAGALAVDAERARFVAADGIPVNTLDPTGAGDVFTAAFLTATLAGLELEDRLRFGCVAAGLSVEHIGGAAGSPQLSELMSWMNSAAGQSAPLHAASVGTVLDRVPAVVDLGRSLCRS